MPNGFEPDRRPQPGKIRAFFALPLPDEVRAALMRAEKNMQQRAGRLTARWQTDEKLHVTLKFLGWVEPESLSSLWEMAAPAIAASKPIDAKITELSAFPNTRRARVLIAKIVDPSGAIAKLAARLESGAEALSIPREDREFRPHVTLARIPRPGDVQKLIAAADLEPLDARLDELRLYRSLLTHEMSFYSVLERRALGG